MEAVSIILAVAVGVGAVVLGLLLLWLAFRVFEHAVATAVELFAWAAEYDFIGVALYIIVWVVATPFMVVVCIIGGVIRLSAEWSSTRPTTPVNGAEVADDDQPERTP